MFERELVRKLVRSPGEDCGVEGGVQRRAAAQQFGICGTGGVCAAHCRSPVACGSLRAAMRRTERSRSHEFRSFECRMIPCAELGGRSGAPEAIRCDNGPEFTSRHFLAWALEKKIEVVHIEPGRPVQNAHVESFHGKLRDECLNASWFGNLFEARVKIAVWKEEYNEERPHSSLGYVAPAVFARRIAALRSPAAPCAQQCEERNEAEVMSSGVSSVV